MYTIRLSNSYSGAAQSVHSVTGGWTGRFQKRMEIFLFATLAGSVLEPRQLVLEALFLAANWPEDEVDHLHPYSAEVRNMLHNVMLKDMDSSVNRLDNAEILVLVPMFRLLWVICMSVYFLSCSELTLFL